MRLVLRQNFTLVAEIYPLNYSIEQKNMFSHTFYPNLPIFLHRYICHICDISQLCKGATFWAKDPFWGPLGFSRHSIQPKWSPNKPNAPHPSIACCMECYMCLQGYIEPPFQPQVPHITLLCTVVTARRRTTA